jgi:hypothetical protein
MPSASRALRVRDAGQGLVAGAAILRLYQAENSLKIVLQPFSQRLVKMAKSPSLRPAMLPQSAGKMLATKPQMSF